MKKLNRLLVVLLAMALAACGEEKKPDAPVEDRYLTNVLDEWYMGKDELAAYLSESAAGVGIVLPEVLVAGFLCDVELASIEYNTVGVDGSDVIASGVIAIPAGTTSYDHLLSIQHVTMDISYAPSRQDFYLEMLPVVGGHVSVMADYLGYGSSQTHDLQHPYLHAGLTGTACADMIEAAREYLRERGITEDADSIELIGYSQGGQATVATLLELEKRGKGKSIRAVHAGGGVYDLENILESFAWAAENSVPYSHTGYAAYLIRGMAYGERLSVHDENLYAPEVISQGLNGMFSTTPLSEWHSRLGSDLSKVLHPDFFAAPSYNGNVDVIAIVEAVSKNSLLNISPEPQSFIHFYHSPEDEQVPYSNSVNAHASWPSSSLTDLAMTDHVSGWFEFIMRYMGLWELFEPFI